MISLLLIEFVIILKGEEMRRIENLLSLTLKLLRYEHVFLQLANNLQII